MSNMEVMFPDPWRKSLESWLQSVYASTQPVPQQGPQPVIPMGIVPPIPPYADLVDTRRVRLTPNMYPHLKFYSICLECRCIDVTGDEYNNVSKESDTMFSKGNC
jgi:hypothetical protein